MGTDQPEPTSGAYGIPQAPVTVSGGLRLPAVAMQPAGDRDGE